METHTVSPRFAFLSALRDFQRRACQVRLLLPVRPLHDRTRRRFRLEGLEERCLLSGISAITEFPLPSGSLSATVYSPEAITAGPDGNLWFTEAGANAIGMINPTTHTISSFTLPIAGAGAYGITTGPDGNLWFAETGAGAIGMINPTTHAISSFTLPAGSRGVDNITTGSNGNLWFTLGASHQIGEINPTTHAISEFTLSPCCYAGPNDITVGPDGNVWFTWAGMNEVAKINPTTDAITYFSVPSGTGPVGITAGPDGNLWFAQGWDPWDGNLVGVINPTTDAISSFSTPTAVSLPWGITAGPDGNLWFTESAVAKIGEINPTTDATTEYSIPYSGSTPYGVTTGPDGNLWFVDPGTNAIGVATLTSSQLVVTQQPQASATAGSPFGLTVEAENSSGNVISSFDGTVTVALASNPGGATLGGTLSVAASDGVATFSNLSLTKAASGYTLDVSASGLGGATTTAITVTPAAATQVAIIEEPPASVTAGSGFGFQASVEDAYGNVVTTANNTVSVALTNDPTGATLGGTLSVTASSGVATFSGLTLTQAASGYTLQASSSGLSSATSSGITVTPAAATQLVITQEPPATVTVNAGFGLQATIEDAYGNVETSSSSTVKLALDDNPAGAKLGGTLSVKASKGVATFSGLTLNKAGTGYTLQVTSSGLSSATTSDISVTSSDAITAPSATTAPDPLLAPLVIDSPSFLESLGLKKHGRSI
jgi:streptogramin lyase